MIDFLELAAALENSPLGIWARGSSFAYPLANLLHLLGLVLLLGSMLLVDLRLLGLFAKLPLRPTVSLLTGTAIAGFFLILPSGFVMFSADAVPLLGSGIFLWKISLILVALANAALFRLIWRRTPFAGDAVPRQFRFMAALSLVLWPTVAALGRLIAYA